MKNNNILAEIITIGTEITTGNTLNTNAQFISKRLFDLGIDSYYQTSVDDDWDRLGQVIKNALSRSNLIIASGGLGPTRDDITKDVFAQVLGLELLSDMDMENKIKAYFASMNRKMTENNLNQAKKPKGSFFLENMLGTAPGIYIEQEEKKIFLLPGPPRELREMFEKEVKPRLNKGRVLLSKSINIMGIGESLLETKLFTMNLSNENTDISTFAKDNSVELRLIAKGNDKDLLKKEINEIYDKINHEFKDNIYGYNNDPIEKVLFDLLIEKKLILSTAESCTGGLITSKITRLPGASQVFDRGIISYSNQSKIKELNVDPEKLDNYGAVSREVALEMAFGLLEKSKVDISASITGIAGPDGGTSSKPIGLVYMCIMDKSHNIILKKNYRGNRETIQNRASLECLNEIRKFILKYY